MTPEEARIRASIRVVHNKLKEEGFFNESTPEPKSRMRLWVCVVTILVGIVSALAWYTYA